MLGIRLLTVECTILLAPVEYGAPPADDRRTATHADVRRTATHVDDRRSTARVDVRRTATRADGRVGGIGARLGPTARLIDESIDDLRALDRPEP